MNQQDALRYLMFDRVPSNPSKLYGKTPIVRAVTTWNVAIQLSDGDETKIDIVLLDEIMDAVERGDNIVELFVSGEYEKRGFMKGKG